jgi:hypothetical protein
LDEATTFEAVYYWEVRRWRKAYQLLQLRQTPANILKPLDILALSRKPFSIQTGSRGHQIGGITGAWKQEPAQRDLGGEAV